MKLSRVQHRYLEFAVRHAGGELRWSPHSNGGGSIRRMVERLVAADLVAFDPKRMAWVVTKIGRAALNDETRRRAPTLLRPQPSR